MHAPQHVCSNITAHLGGIGSSIICSMCQPELGSADRLPPERKLATFPALTAVCWNALEWGRPVTVGQVLRSMCQHMQCAACLSVVVAVCKKMRWWLGCMHKSGRAAYAAVLMLHCYWLETNNVTTIFSMQECCECKYQHGSRRAHSAEAAALAASSSNTVTLCHRAQLQPR